MLACTNCSQTEIVSDMEELYWTYGFILFDNVTSNISEEFSGFPDLTDQEPCSRALRSHMTNIILPAVYGIIFILGLIGNALVIAVIGCQKKVRTIMDKYRLHLSIADLLFVLTLPFWAMDAMQDWYLPGFFCVSMHMIYTVNLYSSVLILAFISLDRYLAIVRATDSQHKRTLLVSKVIYVGVWLPAVCLSIPDLMFVKVQDVRASEFFSVSESQDLAKIKTNCLRIYPADSSIIWMTLLRLQHILVGFLLPGLTILICYCIIIAKISQSVKVRSLNKKKALKNTVILVLCFFGCWLPFCFCLLFENLMILDMISSPCELRQAVEIWICITETLAYFHCCLNPILYAFTGVKFKTAARHTLRSNSIFRRSNRAHVTKR